MNEPVRSVQPTTQRQKDQETGQPVPAHGRLRRISPAGFARVLLGSAIIGWDSLASATEASEPASSPGESQGDKTGEAGPAPGTPAYAAIGFLFEAAESAGRAGSAGLRLADRAASPVMRWAGRSRLLAPARRRFDALAERGSVAVDRWTERGWEEATRSRDLVETAMVQVVDASIDQIAQNPQVVELVQTQGQSLTQEIAEELRERAVSADLLLDRWVCRGLGRQTRRLPASTTEARAAGRAGAVAPCLIGQPAGFVSRLVAFLVDIALIGVSFFIMGSIVETIGSVLGFGFGLGQIPSLLPAIPALDYVGLSLSGTTVFGIGYMVFFWTLGGKTPGKALMGLRITTATGHRLSFVRAVLRLAGYALSALPFYLGFLWITVDRRQRAWHDHLFRTRVIYTWEARPEERWLADELGKPAPKTAGSLPKRADS